MRTSGTLHNHIRSRRPDIALVNPWIHDFAAFDLWARPLGLLVIAELLKDSGWEPHLVDCVTDNAMQTEHQKGVHYGRVRYDRTRLPKPKSLAHVPRHFRQYGADEDTVRSRLNDMPRPKAVLVTGIMTYWYTGVRTTVDIIRECLPGVPIVLGGVYASLMTDHARRAIGADYVLPGPAEYHLNDCLVQRTGFGVSACRDRQLAFKPALDMLQEPRFIPLLTARGCPYRCTYCASNRLIDRFVQWKPESAVDFIAATVDTYDIHDIALFDDAFLVQPERHALPILEETARRIPGLHWHTPNGLHASEISPRVAQAMWDVGFQTIRLGLESSSDDFHAKSGGKTHRDDFVAAVRNLREVGFSEEQIGAYLLVGRPGQSCEHIEADVEFVLECGAHARLAEYSPIPGTALWEESVKASPYPVAEEPLLQNCSLLCAAEPGVDQRFLSRLRHRISEHIAASSGASRGADGTKDEAGNATNLRVVEPARETFMEAVSSVDTNRTS